MLGFLITFVIIFFLAVGMIASIASFSSKDSVEVPPNSVLHLTLSTEIVDRGGRNPFESFDFMSMRPSRTIGLNELIENLKKAKEDENIEGIYLDLSFLATGWASVDEIRQAISDFRESGKFVIAYGETMMQSAYYLASVADEIYMHPEGLIDFRGINAELVFIKNMLDKLGIDPQLIRHGEYKSAGEPLFREDMSRENKEQVLSYISAIWNNIMADVADSRGLTINHLNDVANGVKTRNALSALEWQMIDGIAHRDEIMEIISERSGVEEGEEPRLVTFSKYTNAPLPKSMVTPRSRDKIAVVYGSGNIISGQGSDRIIGSDRIAEAIRDARKDESVKAIVFRINSPGGSALASDVILREVVLAAKEKPVIASMGDLAASGGYYIACGADYIMASSNTLTGSIGVFGMIPNMKEFFNDKLGVTFDNVKTNEFADLGSVSRPLTQAERRLIEGEIAQVYETFIGHVAKGRNIPVSTVDELGRGRVWSGVEARRNGLIDELGGLNDAVIKAAEMAELENYRVVEYPIRKDFLTQIMEDFGGIRERKIQKELGPAYQFYRQWQDVQHMTGILARLPYNIVLE